MHSDFLPSLSCLLAFVPFLGHRHLCPYFGMRSLHSSMLLFCSCSAAARTSLYGPELFSSHPFMVLLLHLASVGIGALNLPLVFNLLPLALLGPVGGPRARSFGSPFRALASYPLFLLCLLSPQPLDLCFASQKNRPLL